MTRAEKVAEAQRLRAEGLLLREIAERMDAKITTVHGWIADPDLSQQRARRDKYSQPCIDCGKATDGSGGFKDRRTRCAQCSRKNQHETREWTNAAVIEAFQRFAREVGRPPRGADINPWLAERLELSDAVERRRRFDEGWLPHCPIVAREFGSHNAAVLAAGLRPYDETIDRDWSAHHPRVAA